VRIYTYIRRKIITVNIAHIIKIVMYQLKIKREGIRKKIFVKPSKWKNV